MTGLQDVSNSNSIIRNLNDNNNNVHLERYSGRPLVNFSKPYWRASASGGKSAGRSSNEMITIEQYAPLITCYQSWNNHSMGKLLYLTSSSPPSQIRKPPSGCFNFPSHLHLFKVRTEIGQRSGQLTLPSGQSADRPLLLRPSPEIALQHSSRQHGTFAHDPRQTHRWGFAWV